ncbi:MAG: stage II sporulation protein D [Oscillospiraceae bacterium]
MMKYETFGRRACKNKAPSGENAVGITVTCALLLLGLAFLLPLAVCGGRTPSAVKIPAEQTETLPAIPQAERGDGGKIRVLLADGTVETMALSDYLFRVVSAEMPASFQPEALKAQTVAARTYALRKGQVGEKNHPNADVCCDIQCCQAYLTPEAAAAQWGGQQEEYTQKIKNAVTETDGVVITYGGALIQAVFFSSTDRRTNDAVAVWGNAVPYLKGVESPEGEGDVPGYRSVVTLPAAEFQAKFLAEYPQAVFGDDPTAWFAAPTLAENGEVEEQTVGGVPVTGIALRGLLGLRSAHFTATVAEGEVRFAVTAYGHGVGLSQYGANVMAQNGADYREILEHYYTGVTVGEKQ